MQGTTRLESPLPDFFNAVFGFINEMFKKLHQKNYLYLKFLAMIDALKQNLAAVKILVIKSD